VKNDQIYKTDRFQKTYSNARAAQYLLKMLENVVANEVLGNDDHV